MHDSGRILIVDDEQSMLTTLEDILITFNYEVFCAENGPQAIELVKKEKIDILLMDFKMPGLNGVQVFREIMKIDSTIKTIFITAFYDENLLQEALDEGACKVFNKPLDIDKLLECIRNIS